MCDNRYSLSKQVVLESKQDGAFCEECFAGYERRLALKKAGSTYKRSLTCPKGETIVSMNTKHVGNQGVKDDGKITIR